MAGWCLTLQTQDLLKQALRKDGDPQKMVDRGTEGRLAWFTDVVGKENANNLNALFESKLLLKNQQKGFQSFIKGLGGSKQVQSDLISKVERMDKALTKAEVEQYLGDLVSKRLGLEALTEEQYKTVSNLQKTTSELKLKADKNGVFPTEKDRLAYGLAKVNFDNYTAKLKANAQKISFKEQPIQYIANLATDIPGIMMSSVASMNDHFFGRQGLPMLLDVRTSKIWIRGFLQSFKNIAKELKSKNAMDGIKADIVSRPNALNGKYKALGRNASLDVSSEEAFPNLRPDKIPLLGRLFSASHVAFNGGALQMRANLADRLIRMAEKNGINSLDKNQMEGTGNFVGSITGRGNLGLSQTSKIAKGVNILLFSPRLLKGNIDKLMAPASYIAGVARIKPFKNEGENFSKKEAARSTLGIIATLVFISTIAKLLDPSSVNEDPRAGHVGQIKIFGHWVDFSSGAGSIVTVASRLAPTMHNGKWSFWSVNSKGQYNDLLHPAFGGQTALDVLDSFWQGKLSPFAGMFRDMWAGKNYSGQATTLKNLIEGAITPMSLAAYTQFINDPSSSNVLGSMILEELGLSTNTTVAPNAQSKTIPLNKPIKNKDFISMVLTYADAMGTDPETAFNRIFTGQVITRVTNGTVIVQRMPLAASQAVKKAGHANNPKMKLDHTIPLEIGGSNDANNLKIVTTSTWASYTPVENALGTALIAGKITKQEAQSEITKFKSIQNATTRKAYGQKIINKYK